MSVRRTCPVNGRSVVLRVAASLCFLGLPACAEADNDADGTPEPSTASVSADDFRAEVEKLCDPVSDMHDDALDTGGSGIEESVEEVIEAEIDLKEDLETLDPPDDQEGAFAEYLEQYGRYVEASKTIVNSEDPRTILAAAVEGAEVAVSLEEAAMAAGLPESCPPVAGVDVHNNLFVARANLGCFDLSEDISVAGSIETPQTAREADLLLDLGEQVSAGIARVLEEADSPGVEDIPVEKMIKANKKRFLAIRDFRRAFDEGYKEFRAVGDRFETVSKAADKLMLSYGLVECARVFSLLPI